MKALVQYDLTPYHRLPLAFTIIKMLMIILEVFLPYEHSSVPVQLCTLPLMSTAGACGMVYHWLPCCYAHTTKNLYKMEVV